MTHPNREELAGRLDVLVDKIMGDRETLILAHIESLRYDRLGGVGYARMSSGRRVRLYKDDYDKLAQAIAALYQRGRRE